MILKDSKGATAIAAGVILCSGMIFSAGCAKKVAVATPPAVKPAATRTETASNNTSRQTTPTAARQRTTTPTASRVPNQATKDQIADLLKRIEDAYFDYNTSNIRADASKTLAADAHTLSEILSSYPEYKLTVEGYCDERGSAEYNLALGEERAERGKSFLEQSGIPAKQLRTVSFGKDRQTCSDHDEACWQKNRRIHITQAQG